jgi:hypothetical protein
MRKGVYDLIGIANRAFSLCAEYQSQVLNIAQEVGRVLCAYRREVCKASESRVSASYTRPSGVLAGAQVLVDCVGECYWFTSQKTNASQRLVTNQV